MLPGQTAPYGVWGDNSSGQLGCCTTAIATLVPVTVSGLTDAVAVAGGTYLSLALKADGNVQSWGLNTNGQLGNNTLTSSSVPTSTFISGVAQPTP
ncbi:hypothetical protein [Deinococcus sp.]|uniref:hypothetical protein n=1 Tax=Deinococcus sp. TaxID=47478 RepID=UPI003CC617C9